MSKKPEGMKPLLAKSVEKDGFQQFLRESRSWETDRLSEALRSRSLAWLIAGCAAVVALCSTAATAVLALKDPEPPAVLRVNNATGSVDVVQRLKGGDTTYDEVSNKYWTELYIRYREGYSRELAEEYYYNTGLMSCAAEQKKYGAQFNPKNPASPLAVYGDAAKVRIVFKGTSFIKPNIALTRFTKEVDRVGSDKPEVTHWAATTVFKYVGARMKEGDRRVNPLGYQACEYRIDSDTASGDPRPLAALSATATPGAGVLPATGPDLSAAALLARAQGVAP